ncbi:MAG: hypothetical protein ACPHY8_02910 [Patescibacteria group bacterium]
MNKIIAPHIVGVPAFALCNFSKIVAFQIVASLRICFPNLNSMRKLIKLGINMNQTRNVAIQNENIKMRFDSIYFS